MFNIPNNTTLFAMLLGSGVIAAGLTQAATFLFAKGNNQRQARYLALRSTLVIEEFGAACLDLVYENDAGEDGEPWGKQHVSLPSFEGLPDDTDGWRALPADLANRLLTFPSTIRSQQRNIDFYWHNTDVDDALGQCRKSAIELGCDADLLGKDIRRQMKLPLRDGKWNWGRRLQDFRAKLNQQSSSQVLT